MNDESTHEDVLFHRALERTATPAEWDSLATLAEVDPLVWRRLAAGLRDECGLAGSRDLLAVAERVELPATSGGPAFRSGRRGFGWIAAAALFLLWVATALRPAAALRPTDAERSDASLRASWVASVSPAAAPQVAALGELPKVLVDARREADGWELVYLHREYQSVRVPRLYGLGEDEIGRPAAIPLSPLAGADFEEL